MKYPSLIAVAILSLTAFVPYIDAKSSSASSASSSSSVKLTLNCMQSAAVERENEIQLSLDTYYQSMSRMLDLRRGLIQKYWGIKDIKKRDQGLRTVWRTFGQGWRKMNNQMRDERREAWENYRTKQSSCGIYKNSDPETAGLAADSQ